MNYEFCSSCGNPTKPHLYRHIPVPIKIEYDLMGNFYTINCNEFKEKVPLPTESRCAFVQCNLPKIIHSRVISTHDFVSKEPDKVPERNVILYCPDETRCGICGVVFNEHITRHIFRLRVKLLNKRENDKFSVRNTKRTVELFDVDKGEVVKEVPH